MTATQKKDNKKCLIVNSDLTLNEASTCARNNCQGNASGDPRRRVFLLLTCVVSSRSCVRRFELFELKPAGKADYTLRGAEPQEERDISNKRASPRAVLREARADRSSFLHPNRSSRVILQADDRRSSSTMSLSLSVFLVEICTNCAIPTIVDYYRPRHIYRRISARLVSPIRHFKNTEARE